MRCERGAGLFAQARDHVQRAGGQAALECDVGQGQHREAGFLGRLEHAGVAHRECGADASADDLHRVDPGHDGACDAVRLAQREGREAGLERQRVAVHLVGCTAVELEVARQRHGVGAALLERLADIERLQVREQLHPLQHLAADGAENAAAPGSARPRSAAVQRPHAPSSAAPFAADEQQRRVERDGKWRGKAHDGSVEEVRAGYAAGCLLLRD